MNHSKIFHPKSCLRVISLLILIVFITTNHFSLPAFAAEKRGQVQNSQNIPIPFSISSLKVPAGIGRIEEVYQARVQETGGKEQTSPHARRLVPLAPFVVLIQDAHAIPDAQRNIQKLIEYFQKEYGINKVALEGASSELDSQILQSFPDKEILKETFNEYFERGELPGATAAAIFSENAARYHGVEDWELYEEGVGLYLTAMEKEAELGEKLQAAGRRLQVEKEKVYSPELLEIDRTLQAFHKNEADLIQVLKTLEKRRGKFTKTGTGREGLPVPFSVQALIEEIEKDGRDQTAIEREVRKIAERVKGYLESVQRTAYGVPRNNDLHLRSTQNAVLRTFNQKYQAFQTSRITPEAFALFLKELIESGRGSWGMSLEVEKGTGRGVLPVPFSEELARLIKHHKRLRDIEGTQFFRDFEAHVKSVKESLFRNEEERRLDAESRKLELLEKLANLELSREEWAALRASRHWRTSPSAGLADRREEMKTKDHRPKTTDRVELEGLLSDHYAFYENAEQREQALLRNLLDLMNSLNGLNSVSAHSAILVAGGFHTEGLARQFKQSGISYVIVRPEIKSIPEENRYREHMRGEVSWKGYFEIENGSEAVPGGGKVNLYKAFVRGARDRLLKGQETRDTGQEVSFPLSPVSRPLLKAWRDQILRDLAQKEQLTKAHEYTQFLDEVIPNASHRPARALAENTLHEIRNQWLANINHFTESLKKLKSHNQLTEQNILKLLEPSMMADPVTYRVLSPYEWSPIVGRLNLRAELRPKFRNFGTPLGTGRSELRPKSNNFGTSFGTGRSELRMNSRGKRFLIEAARADSKGDFIQSGYMIGKAKKSFKQARKLSAIGIQNRENRSNPLAKQKENASFKTHLVGRRNIFKALRTLGLKDDAIHKILPLNHFDILYAEMTLSDIEPYILALHHRTRNQLEIFELTKESVRKLVFDEDVNEGDVKDFGLYLTKEGSWRLVTMTHYEGAGWGYVDVGLFALDPNQSGPQRLLKKSFLGDVQNPRNFYQVLGSKLLVFKEKNQTHIYYSLETGAKIHSEQVNHSSRSEVRHISRPEFKGKEINAGLIFGDGESDTGQKEMRLKMSGQDPLTLDKSTWWFQPFFSLTEGYNKALTNATNRIATAMEIFRRPLSVSKKLLARAAPIIKYMTLASMLAIKILRSSPRKFVLGIFSIGSWFIPHRIYFSIFSSAFISTQGRKIQSVQSSELSNETKNTFLPRPAYQTTSLTSDKLKRTQTNPIYVLNIQPPLLYRLASAVKVLAFMFSPLGGFYELKYIMNIILNQENIINNKNPIMVRSRSEVHSAVEAQTKENWKGMVEDVRKQFREFEGEESFRSEVRAKELQKERNLAGGFKGNEAFLKLFQVIFGGEGRKYFSDKNHFNFEMFYAIANIGQILAYIGDIFPHILHPLTKNSELTAEVFENNSHLARFRKFWAFFSFHPIGIPLNHFVYQRRSVAEGQAFVNINKRDNIFNKSSNYARGRLAPPPEQEDIDTNRRAEVRGQKLERGQELLSQPVESLEVEGLRPKRIYTKLGKRNINTLGDLVAIEEERLPAESGLGPESIDQLKKALAKKGLRLKSVMENPNNLETLGFDIHLTRALRRLLTALEKEGDVTGLVTLREEDLRRVSYAPSRTQEEAVFLIKEALEKRGIKLKPQHRSEVRSELRNDLHYELFSFLYDVEDSFQEEAFAIRALFLRLMWKQYKNLSPIHRNSQLEQDALKLGISTEQQKLFVERFSSLAKAQGDIHFGNLFYDAFEYFSLTIPEEELEKEISDWQTGIFEPEGKKVKGLYPWDRHIVYVVNDLVNQLLAVKGNQVEISYEEKKNSPYLHLVFSGHQFTPSGGEESSMRLPKFAEKDTVISYQSLVLYLQGLARLGGVSMFGTGTVEGIFSLRTETPLLMHILLHRRGKKPPLIQLLIHSEDKTEFTGRSELRQGDLTGVLQLLAPQAIRPRLLRSERRKVSWVIRKELERDDIETLRRQLIQFVDAQLPTLLRQAQSDVERIRYENLQKLMRILDKAYQNLAQDFPDQKVPLAIDFDLRLLDIFKESLEARVSWIRQIIIPERRVRVPRGFLKIFKAPRLEPDLNKVAETEEGFGYIHFDQKIPDRVALNSRIGIVRHRGDLTNLDLWTLKALAALDVLFAVSYGLRGETSAAYLKKQYPELFSFFAPSTFTFGGQSVVEISIHQLEQSLMNEKIMKTAA